ncbi:helix-turn-helix domain-containing protein [Micromonospora sp. KC207]|nr:helix-turn-helix domain-containing protein [Micromonospora sp. KC207]TDC64382.1 helix-turn-helix domain-containing protein [Micromonospora sp. KC207]
MRPAQTYANLTDAQYQQLLTALHQQWRVAVRAVMILLSADGMPPAEIAELLHYDDPVTVRRWIRRHDAEGLPGLPDRPRSGYPRHGRTRLGTRIRALLATPKAWTTIRIWRARTPRGSPPHHLPAHPRTSQLAPTPPDSQDRNVSRD